ncbi:hypothetical protein BD779DRAFT_1582195 [Infundibulicybe gibba]|nr:hypothetical protein BD779DRAFT_1582195 [Infundibulicybe gibba]
MEHPPHKSSRRVPGRYPPRGTSQSQMRFEIGVGALPGDIRELMPVARTHGLDTAQLYIIRDTDTPLPPSSGILNTFQTAALIFADHSTRHVKVADSVIEELRSELGKHLESKDGKDDLLVEAAAIVASYNMVSRFLVSLDPVAPWLVFANSLLTDYSMWAPLIPYLLPSGSGKQSYNLLLHSQRGHGLSTCVIGVSQGGAAALAFAAKYAHMTKSVVVCDTAAQTPSGNQQAWEARIAMALGKDGAGEVSQSEYTYAEKLGMGNLASVTIERWFPKGSRCSAGGDRFNTRARALGDYDLIKEGLMESAIEHVLFVWGSLDGGGRVGLGLEVLGRDWNSKRSGRELIELQAIEGSGHLPMIDETGSFSWLFILPEEIGKQRCAIRNNEG